MIEDYRILCPCESPVFTGSMIQCQECHVLQHSGCVLISEDPREVLPSVPPQFYCEICRISRADPFWVTMAYSLYPVKLTTSNIQANGLYPVQNLERVFHLTRLERELLLKPDHDIQVWCLLLNDRVPYRMQWPLFVDLQVNGIAFQTVDRPSSQLLGANGRDKGSIITAAVSDGLNTISITGCDARSFCLGIRIVKRRTIQEVLNLIPKEPEGEQFKDALARVCRCIGGGAALNNADSDSDLEIVADSVIVNLCCPLSGTRMKTASRFKSCSHMGCFDLESFVELNQRSQKWQCPICLKNYSLDDINIDPYFNRIIVKMQNFGDVTEIEVKPDGSWRAKNGSECTDIFQWHFPDSTPFVATDEMKLNQETFSQSKKGSASERPFGIGTNNNFSMSWNSYIPEDTYITSSGNILLDKYAEDFSVKQEHYGHFDLSVNPGNELITGTLNTESTCYSAYKDLSTPVENAEIIVLSDIEEDDENLIPPQTICVIAQGDNNGVDLYVPDPGVSVSYPENWGLTTAGTSCLSVYNGHYDGSNSMMPQRPSHSGFQAVSGSTLFYPELNVSDYDAQRSTITCSSPMNLYSTAPSLQIDYSTQLSDFVGLNSCNGGAGGYAVENGSKFGNQLVRMEGSMNSSANTARFLSSLNDDNLIGTTQSDNIYLYSSPSHKQEMRC